MDLDKELNIELRDNVAQGSYSNLAIITHSSSEFILDFIRMMPGVPKAQVTNRIIMNPEHIKRFYMALKDNLLKYESQFGEIEIHNSQPNKVPINFGNSSAEA